MAKVKRPVPGLRRLAELIEFFENELDDARIDAAHRRDGNTDGSTVSPRTEALEDAIALFEALSPKSRG